MFWQLLLLLAKGIGFVFDGEVPFGVSVNQVPPTGKPTHFKHVFQPI